MQKYLRLIPLLAVIIASAAFAETADLLQTTADLESQTNDKERMDTKGVTKIEINEIRTWLSDAANAIQEEDEELTRKIFKRVRLQFDLIDQLLALSAVKNEAQKLEAALKRANTTLNKDEEELQKKQDKIRAMKMVESK